MLGLHYRSLRFSRVLKLSGFLNRDFMDGLVGQLLETPRHALCTLVSQWG